METATLKIVQDSPPPKIVAQAMIEAVGPSPINDVVAGVVPPPRGRHLDVDDILACSLPKVTESFKKAA